MPLDVTVTASDVLEAVGTDEVLALAQRAEQVDGAAPLNEAALLHLRRRRPAVRHLSARRGESLVGYAQLETGPDATVAQLVVDPDHRRHGVGTRLAEVLLDAAAGELRAWSAGASPAAAALARRVGLVVGRELSIMTRDLTTGWPEPAVPDGIEIRAFVPGRDEQAWLDVNARAFSHHPEQGSTTRADLEERMAEPWFDPAGFLLAFRGSELQGFHWTKQHENHLGEVYVLGIDPDAAGAGLGKVLLAAGLRHLREQGNTEVELYVESDHPQAVGLYRGYGFTTTSRDVMYVQPTRPGPQTTTNPHEQEN